MKSRDLYLKTLKNSPVTYGRMFGYNKLGELHNEWIKKFLFSIDDYTLMAHRGSYKTTCLEVALALLMIFRPDQNCIILRKTDDDIKEVVGTVEKILNHPKMVAMVSDLYGGEFSIKSTASQVNTSLNLKTGKIPQLLGIGIGGSLTGKHADRIFTDDIVNVKDRFSRAERIATDNAYMELENIKNPGGVIGNTGTPWHKDDTFRLMPKPIKYPVKSTDILDRAAIEDRRSKMTASLFAANYELRHIAADNVLFTSPVFADADSERLLESGYNSYVHIDASYGGSDFTALTIISVVDDKVIVFGKLYDRHVSSVMPQIKMWITKFMGGKCLVENNADKGYLARELNENGVICDTYHESQNKYYKISTYLIKRWGDIRFHHGTDDGYLNQILDYNDNVDHDDAPDSLASILRYIDKRSYVI